MRTTVQIDDDLLRELRQQAEQERTSLTKMLNRVLRHGMRSRTEQKKQMPPFRQETFSMGTANFDVDRALAYAAAREDEEICEKLARRK